MCTLKGFKEKSFQDLKEEVGKVGSGSCSFREETSEHLDLESRNWGHQKKADAKNQQRGPCDIGQGRQKMLKEQALSLH